ncbi:MAG: metallophosphoesterase [Sulfurovum sp.]
MRIYDKETQKEIATLKGHSDMVTSVAIEGDMVVSGSDDNTIKLWSRETQKEIVSMDYFHSSLSYSNSILMIGNDSRVSFVDMSNISNPKDMALSFDARSPIISVSLKKDGSFVFVSKAGDIYADRLNQNIELSHQDQENKFSIKTLLLGDSGVGKTTLGNWIEYGDYDRDIVSTHGMQFFRYEFKEAIEVKVRGEKKHHKFALDIWDFGGQPTYQIAHKQNFDNARLVLLVADMSRQNSDDNSINYWINSIKEHIGVMCSEQLGIFVIGTNSTDKATEKIRLEEITKKIDSAIDCKVIDSIIVDVSQEDKPTLIIDKLQEYIKTSIEIESEHVLGSNSLFVLERLQEIRKEQFCIENIERLQEMIGDEKISIGNIEATINLLSSYGIVEKLKEHIILKPYWKNIFVNAILEYASCNSIVSATISMRDLMGYKFGVDFDNPLKSQEKYKSDEEIYKEEFERLDNGIKRSFILSIVERLLTDKICYMRNGSFVFPSRFGEKRERFDTSTYHKIDTISLVSSQNVEVTIGVVIVSLYYAEQYTIVKQLDKGVKIEDQEGNNYLIEFDRKDLSKANDRQNQANTTITLYTQNDNSAKDRLSHFVEMILEDNLSPIYESKSFMVKDKETQELLGEMQLTIKPHDINKYKLNGFKLEEIQKSKSKDRRILSNLKEKIKFEHQKILKKLDSISDEVKNEFRILHLSDLHFGNDTDIKTELILLKADIVLKDIDYIVLSGDLTAKATKDDFRKIFAFISDLIEYFGIDAQKVMIVAGNHDYRVDEKIFLKRDNRKWEKRFGHFSQYLYESLYNQSFPTDINRQIKVIEDENLVFVLINTSIDIDHFNPLKVRFDTKSFINIHSNPPKYKYKIVVGHHPLNYENSYDFSASLYKFGYKIYMHGHVHRNNLISFHDMIASDNPLIQIGAGLFSNPNQKSMIAGVPLRYNIVTIEKESKKVTIDTKERQNTELPWQKAYIYPDDNGGFCCSKSI